MPDTPNTAEPGKPRRRWFQFRLRTLLIGVTLLGAACAYLGWQAKVVAHRKWVVKNVLMNRPRKVVYWLEDYSPVGRIPWIRRTLGDVSIMSVGGGEDAQEEFEQIQSTFLEAKIERISR